MKVYLTAPTVRVKNNINLFKDILLVLKDQSFVNSNDYIARLVEKQDIKTSNNVYKETLRKIRKSDLVIADISIPSISVGSIIEFALKSEIPSLYICEDKFIDNIPTILKNNKSLLRSKLIYNRSNVKKLLTDFLRDFEKNKIKFNVFIDVEINNYLQWNANKLGTSKSNYFRKLISEKIKEDKEYSK